MKSVKRERGPNWDTQEKEIFFHCVSKFKHVIEDPKKDFNSNQKKHEAWEKVTNDFNSHAQVQKREVKNLKKLWETEKAKSRKTFTSERYSRLKTGGGSYEATPDSVQNPEVEELIGKPHIVEWTNNYDSDGIIF
ncbi:myb/SANT-like DNA-binding domain-containing protein 3 [Myzus persicae]|uniref:myb/SANT-like DNA-binding domain-containing protein 3 n=1 Tax=Myzus persicae TaxID=13164 RepID=UPI000B9353DF|nr:myb/SANT-like DNA-binding domain-containing protein 3 [Myzus persicae]